MRLGIFGGAFDPVHYGHLLLAETCLEARRLDAVWFMPSAVGPHKQDKNLAPAKDRAQMLELAIAGHSRFSVCSYEIDRGGVNYTVDTLAALRAQDASRELFLLLGADSLTDFPTWREPAKICELATLIVVNRGGLPSPNFDVLKDLVSAGRLSEFKSQQVTMPDVDYSASDLRHRVAADQSIRYRTPRAVEKYIETHGLYKES